MADQRSMGHVGRALIEQGFEPSRRAVQEERSDFIGHSSFYHRGNRRKSDDLAIG